MKNTIWYVLIIMALVGIVAGGAVMWREEVFAPPEEMPTEEPQTVE